MAELGQLKTLEVWNRSLGMDELVGSIEDSTERKRDVEQLRSVRGVDELVGAINDPGLRERAVQVLRKARGKSIAEAIFPKQTVLKGGRPVIKDEPPTIFHPKGLTLGEIPQVFRGLMAAYRASLPSSSQSLLDQFRLRDAAFLCRPEREGPCSLRPRREVRQGAGGHREGEVTRSRARERRVPRSCHALGPVASCHVHSCRPGHRRGTEVPQGCEANGIEKPILELLDIDRETELDLTTDGERLIIAPVRKGRRERVRDSLARAFVAHDRSLRKLAR
jgi:hypothetical protein